MKKEIKLNADGTPRKRKIMTLSEREVTLFNEVMSGKSCAEAAIIAGYGENNANFVGWRAFQQVKRKMSEVLDENGLTNEEVVKCHLKPLLSATEVKVFKTKDDEIIYSKPLEALGIRVAALDMVHKIKGAYARPEHENSGTTNVTNNVQIINHIERPKRELGPAIN